MKPNRTKQFAVQFVVTYVIFVVVKMLESMVLDEHIAAQRILASIETLGFALLFSLFTVFFGRRLR
ncbi:hypothetical protein HMPREF1991_01787 [Hoylesella loescheii DSM 19665 = JCM 12249 = ATCC 15930]|uniref:Uncharacterized protein n=1 Tax=Hoylesella loescheii DSM 19665 = JCM 12249 = ATCC 15930 TaxID=1122985 RepID=A0A069QHL5_HOYLO|nr:hypothetical protein HMPREF1991_01787 [Hoylesella loescheii DSM 19665 = JCM 12249 = ATCC 15930]